MKMKEMFRPRHCGVVASSVLAAWLAVTFAPAHAQIESAGDYAPTPAFAGQTKAPPPAERSSYQVETLVSSLVQPWSLAFLPDGGMLVTERPGRLRLVDEDGQLSEPLGGLPPIVAFGAAGLHDVVLDPEFADNRLLYFSYQTTPPAEPPGDPASYSPGDLAASLFGFQRVARARLSADNTRLDDVEVVLEAGGRRLLFAPDGTLLVTTQGAAGRDAPVIDAPQRLASYRGKVLRINPDGSIPEDNPWFGQEGARPEIYARGVRDPEGAAFHPQTGDLWMIEHGPQGGDEINIIRAGRNYGYPIITYGRNYDDQPIGEGLTAMNGMEQPLYFWVPSIAPSGMLFYAGDLFPDWTGNLFVGALVGTHLQRLVLDGDRVVREERLLLDLGQRIRDVRQGPDGALYLLTSEMDGRLLKLTPRIE